MTLEEIKQAVLAGKTVHWSSKAYKVERNKAGQWLVKCTLNGSWYPLTHSDGVTMDYKPSDFFIAGEVTA